MPKVDFNILEKIANNNELDDNIRNNINSILDVDIDDIKKDVQKGIILSILERITMITFNTVLLNDANAFNADNKSSKDASNVDNKSSKDASNNDTIKNKPLEANNEKSNVKNLYKLYTEAKEIVVKYRNEKINCIVALSDAFNLTIIKPELTYFMLIMYQVGIKLNDTYPMIPGLFKKQLPLCDLSMYFDKVEEYMSNKNTDWVEFKEYNSNELTLMPFEYAISYASLHDSLYVGFVRNDLRSTIYVSKDNAKVILDNNIYNERMIYSKYLTPKHQMIVVL